MTKKNSKSQQQKTYDSLGIKFESVKPMVTVTIKTAYDQYGDQYWFAQDEDNHYFQWCHEIKNRGFQPKATIYTKFESLKDLENKLKSHFERIRKINLNPEFVKTLEF